MTEQGPVALPHAFFLPVDPHASRAGQRFCLFHPAGGGTERGRVLYLHPFAEELNTTRRVVAQQARALAAAGYAVLQIDMTGCGDSFGDFSEATWSTWMADAAMAHGWLNQATRGPLWLWGMRSGALLASELLKTLPQAHLLLWQPVIRGQQMLQQFVRLHAASHWLGSGQADDLSPTQRLAQGRSVEIAGYTITPELAAGLAQAFLRPTPSNGDRRLVWIEMGTQNQPVLGPASENEVAAWQNAGWQVDAQVIQAPAFWQTVGTEEVPDLIRATLSAMAGGGPGKEDHLP